jgi:hypothetical protein
VRAKLRHCLLDSADCQRGVSQPGHCGERQQLGRTERKQFLVRHRADGARKTASSGLDPRFLPKFSLCFICCRSEASNSGAEASQAQLPSSEPLLPSCAVSALRDRTAPFAVSMKRFRPRQDVRCSQPPNGRGTNDTATLGSGSRFGHNILQVKQAPILIKIGCTVEVLEALLRS